MSRLFLGFFGFVSFIGAIFGRLFIEVARYVPLPFDLHIIPPIGRDDHSIAFRVANQVGQGWRTRLDRRNPVLA